MGNEGGWQQLITVYFLQTGVGWAMLGGMIAVALGATGSAIGIRTACSQGAGVLSEKPELFGKLLVLMALPGTQGFYSFICLVFIAFRIRLIAASAESGVSVAVAPLVGLALAFVGAGVGYVQLKSAIAQGETSAAAINLVARKPEESGRAILLPALVETYALVALLAGILMTFLLTKAMPFASPVIEMAQ
jgi:V/A-type H+-transporting ATPase subunit K